MNICRRFLIHFKSGISIGKKYIFILDGDHVLLDNDLVIVSAVNLDIVGSKVDTECIVSQNNSPFLL